MILTTLTLTDFGTYRGQQTIALRPKKSRPIVLFGGKNGCGKSTLLEAIRLCFYGPGAISAKSKEEYLRYLDQRIHSNPQALIQPTSAAVAVEFQYGDTDGLHTYRVTRSWERKSSGRIVEDLRVERDERPLDEVSADHWQDFVRDLLPPGVSSLFFFDGEKIQNLAEDSPDQQTLSVAVKSLLGLDVVERLQTDLGIYLARISKPVNGSSQTSQEVTSLQAEMAELQEGTAECHCRRESAQARVRELRTAATRLEEKIASQGGHLVRNREELIQKQGSLKALIDQHEARIRDLCTGLFPFALVPDLCRQLGKRLLYEQSLMQASAARRLLDSFHSEISDKLQSAEFWKDMGQVNSSVKAKVRARVTELIESSPVLGGADEPDITHDVSDQERLRLLSWIGQVTEELPNVLHPLTGEAERLYRDLQKTEQALRRIPADDVLKPVLEELRSVNNELADASRDLLRVEDELKSKELKMAELRRRFDQATRKLAEQLEHASRVHLVPRVQKVLDEYRASLIHKKVLDLQETVTDCFHALCRKKDSLGRIIVNPTDFSVVLQDKHNRPLPKSQLSAGEKQIYAISMLWALGKTSGRPLPIIIDTPLARLDSDHRKLLAHRYFPLASHQVLILSTDTEVDQDYFGELRGAVAQSYRLDFEPEENGTKIMPGYFWSHSNEAN